MSKKWVQKKDSYNFWINVYIFVWLKQFYYEKKNITVQIQIR